MCRKAQYDCMDKFQLRRVRKRNAGVLSLEAAMVASLLVLALVSVGGWVKIDAERALSVFCVEKRGAGGAERNQYLWSNVFNARLQRAVRRARYGGGH